jgi:hypothetical protein
MSRAEMIAPQESGTVALTLDERKRKARLAEEIVRNLVQKEKE